MELNDLLSKIHKYIEIKEDKDITRAKMALKIGVKPRTYTEYRRGINQPLAMKALLNLLVELEDDEIIKVIRSWENKEKK
jgi:DNA-binding XRE family transcriptional regulator